MAKIEYLFCEGNRESLDRQVLEKIVGQIPAAPTIVPAGGKGNMSNFIQGYLEKSSVRNITDANYVGFRDRDFDGKVPPSPPQLSKSQKPRIVFSYRAAIENYLFDPNLFYEFILKQELVDTTGIRSPADAISFFSESAEKIKVYTAVRWALADMREPVQVGTTWTDGSGDLPSDLDQDHCLREAQNYIRQIRSKFDHYTERRFDDLYQTYLATFDSAFFEQQGYLIWFHGKDLKEIMRTDDRLKSTSFSFKKFEKFALGRFDFQRFADLVQLFDLLKGGLSFDDIAEI